MKIAVETSLEERFPGLQVLICHLDGLLVENEEVELRLFKEKVSEEIRRKYDLATVKDVPVFRAYRDFFWRAGIDPTKVRPAAEALIRRVLAGKPIPTINTLVDSYNLASIQTGIAMAAFDADKLRGDLTLRLARPGERFLGIAMAEPMELGGNELVIDDAEKLVAVYPYRDADGTKADLDTSSVYLLMCGAPGIDMSLLEAASLVAVDYVTRFCGGKVGMAT